MGEKIRQQRGRRTAFRAVIASPHWPIFAAASFAGSLLGSSRFTCASTIRDDVPDSEYTALAAEPQYASSGFITANENNGFYSFGSGTLIAPDWVLTAAHVVTENTTGTPTFPVAGISFGQGPSYSVPAPLPAAQVVVEPGWTYDLSLGNDLALIQLATPITNVAPAPLYNSAFGSELNQTDTVVGYGKTGTGLTGDTGSLGTRRAIQNTIAAFGGQTVTGGPPTYYTNSLAGYSSNIAYTDFAQPGNPSTSVMGNPTPLPLAGSSAPGDSGGGLFLNYNGTAYLAGVTDFLGVFANNLYSTSPDGHYGDYDGYTRLAVPESMSFIDSQLVVASTWTAGSASWSSLGNWNNSEIPEFAGATANFSGNSSATNITLDASWTVGTVTFANAASYTIAAGNAGTLTLDNGLGNGSALIVDSQGTHTISAPVALNSNLLVSVVNATDVFRLSGGISGAGGITKVGAGTTILSGAGSYAGATVVSGGLLELSSSAATAASSSLTVSTGGAVGVEDGSTIDTAFIHQLTAASPAGGFALAPSDANVNIDFTGAVPGAFNMLLPPAAAGGAGGSLAGMSVGALSGGVTYTGTITPANNKYQLGGGGVLTLGMTSAGSVPLVDGTASNNVLIENGGTVALTTTNSYTGVTTINGVSISSNPLLGTTAVESSVLRVTYLGDPGSADGSSIGNSDPTNPANLVINGGSLQYAGSGDTSQRLFTIGALGAAIHSSGTAPLSLTNASPEAFAAGVSGTVSLTLAGTNGGTNTINSTIANPASGKLMLAKSGSGLWIIGGANSYTGGTTVNGGTLRMASPSALGSTVAALTVNAGGTLDLNGLSLTVGVLSGAGAISNSGGQTPTLTIGAGIASSVFSGAIADGNGVLSLVKTGSGIITLRGTGNYSGGTTLSSGTLAIASDVAVNSGAGGTTFSGGTLQFQNYTSNLSFISTANLSLGAAAGAASTLAGQISGNSALNYVGPGTLALLGNNNFTGGATIVGGELSISSDASIGGPAGAINFAGGNLQVTGNALTNINSHAVNWATFNGGFDIASSTNVFTVAANISGNGSLAKSGAGTLLLSGSNSYQGGTTIQAGTLAINTDAAIPSAANLIFTGGTLQFNNYPSNLSFPSVNNLTLGAAAGTAATLNGTISGTSPLNFVGPGTLILTASNSYTGGTTLSGGELSVASIGSLGDFNTPLNFNGGILQITGNSFNRLDQRDNSQINWDSFNGGFDIVSPTANFILDYAISGFGSLSKLGAGTLVATVDNTYTGGTTISGGTLQLGIGGNAGDLGAKGAIVDNGLLNINRGDTALTIIQAISGNGAVAMAGAGLITLAGNNSYSGGTNLNNGEVSISADANIGGPNTPVNFNGGTLQITGTSLNNLNSHAVNWTTFNGGFDINSSTETFTVSNSISGNGSLNKLGAGTLVLNGVNTYGGTTTINTGRLQLGAGGSTGSLGAGPVVDKTSFFIDRGDGALVLSNNISGNGTVIVGGGGTVTFTGTNTYAGSTTIQAATTLQLGNGGTTGSITSAVISDLGTLILNRSNVSTTLAGTISGAGSVVQAGSGTVTFTTNNSYSGITTINSGTLQLGAGGTVGAVGTGNIVDNSSLIIDRSDPTLSFNNSISGNGSITLAGSTPVTFNGTNTYSGGTNILAGSLTIPSTSALPAGGNVLNNTSLTINAGTSAAPVSIGRLTGGGTLTVGQTNAPAYLRLTGNSTISSVGSLTLASGSTLDLTSNTLDINYGSAIKDPVTTIRTELQSAYAGGVWTGVGLTSTTVQAQVANAIAHGGGVWSIGYADGNTDVYGGAAANQLIIKPALAGDANLDGSVTFIDLGIVAQNLGHTNTDWTHGDFNYDGTTNFLDIGLLAQNLNYSLLNTPLGADFPVSFQAQWNLAVAEIKANDVTNVPEPVAGTLLTISAAGLLMRRRKSRTNS